MTKVCRFLPLIRALYLFLFIGIASAHSHDKRILVVGSINADTFLPVARLPTEGENLTLLPGTHPSVDIPGGKGCTQAIAAAKLMEGGDSVAFVGQFGNDPAAQILRRALADANVDISFCETHDDLPSGRGYVFLTQSGSVSAIVTGGSNLYGWEAWKHAWEAREASIDAILEGEQPVSMSPSSQLDVSEQLRSMLEGVQCILLQREVPEFVNLLVATRAKQMGGILVLQDVGGEDRPITRDMLQVCDYLMPNESELRRLLKSLGEPDVTLSSDRDENDDDGDLIVKQAKLLQQYGASNVLVTRGSRGSLLVTKSGEVLYQAGHKLAPEDVVDETGAGDCYRAAFAVSLLDGHPLQQCMEFAGAAGACSVTHHGAVPSTPTRSMIEQRLRLSSNHQLHHGEETVMHIPRGGDDFPFLIGSRLNSMKDRPELWRGELKDARDFVKRQATVRGLTCVDFNYPQHFHDWTPSEARQALDEAGLVAGSVCLRYSSKFARGSFNHPDPELRREAIELTKQAAQAAIELGCKEVVVWSAFDGYDYPFQVDYDEKWKQQVEAFQEVCDAFPDIKFSLEYKPTDENTRFFTVPSTGAALLLADEVDRPNFGLTMDVGHMLMSGENPGQSIAMVARKKKLFGVQLNDGYTRLAAEDGLMFGSVHPSMALEVVYQLRKTGFDGHMYFDTFPQRTDPILEAEYNIRKVKALWKTAASLDQDRISQAAREHDAIAAIEIVDKAFRMM